MENIVIHNFKVTGIYLIHNTISKKSYIGSALNIYKRIFGTSSISHLKALSKNTHTNKHLQRAFNKYGIESFTFKILEICTRDALLEREQYYLDTYLGAQDSKQFKKKAYNICPTAGSPLGRKMSKAFKKKCSLGKMGKKNPMYGKSGIKNHRSLSIVQYDVKGNFIKKHNNVAEASKNLNISTGAIRNAIQKGYKGGGYYWKNLTENFLEKIPTKKSLTRRIIAQSVLSTATLEFNSLSEASIHFKMERKAFSNAVNSAIQKKNGLYKNYIWMEKN